MQTWDNNRGDRMRERRLTMFGTVILVLLSTFGGTSVHAQSNVTEGCGELVTIHTHDRTTTRYALAYPQPAPAGGARAALILLAGGGGHLDLDSKGCARALTGNSLVRSVSNFHSEGFVTALVDAPSDHMDEDGLGGFRVSPKHADDLGKVIADIRRRTQGPVWLVGTSRGSISAANAAARLAGPSAPDGIVLTSALMSGTHGGQKSWVADTVFDLPLEAIRVPVLVVGHAEDKCLRSPPGRMNDITARTRGTREQVVTVTGGPGWPGVTSVGACIGRAPHGFVGQEAEVVSGIARFVAGGRY